jgi:hypothetical protein
VQIVVAVDGEQGRHDRYRHDHDGPVPPEEPAEARGDEHGVDDVEGDEREERGHERQQDAPVAELAPGLDHLRQPELRALDRVERHEERPEQDAQGTRDYRPS